MKNLGRGGMNRDLKDILVGPEAFRCLVENAALPIAIADIRDASSMLMRRWQMH